jgi:hypothetical protein
MRERIPGRRERIPDGRERIADALGRIAERLERVSDVCGRIPESNIGRADLRRAGGMLFSSGNSYQARGNKDGRR